MATKISAFITYLLSFLLLFPAVSKAQSIALLDMHFKAPFMYANTVGPETFAQGIFPVYVKEVRSIIAAVENVRKKINRHKGDAGTDSVRVGYSMLIWQMQAVRHIRKYTLVLCTDVNGMKAYTELIDGYYNRAAQQRIVTFLDYLRNNISITKDAALLNK